MSDFFFALFVTSSIDHRSFATCDMFRSYSCSTTAFRFLSCITAIISLEINDPVRCVSRTSLALIVSSVLIAL